MTAVVVAERCSKWYGHVLGISDLSWKLPPGIVGLLGPNGAGKSTLMKLMAGLIQPSRGTLQVFGDSPFRSADVRRRIGHAPEHEKTYDELSALELVTALARLSGLAPAEARRAAAEALDSMGMASAMHLLGSAIAFAGGGLVGAVDLTLPYVLTAAVAALALAVAMALSDDRAPRDRPSAAASPGPGSPAATAALQGWWHDVVAALSLVRRRPRLAWLVAYSAVVFTLLRATIYVYQPYLEQRGFGLIQIGLLFAAMYVVAAVIAYRTHALRARYSEDQLLWGLLGVLAASFLLLGQVHSGPLLAALLAVQAVASGLFSPLTKPLLHREIADSQRRAAVLSVESMARRASLGLFAPLAGLYGQSHVMVLCGVVGLAGIVVLALVRVPAHAGLEAAGQGVAPHGRMPAGLPAVSSELPKG